MVFAAIANTLAVFFAGVAVGALSLYTIYWYLGIHTNEKKEEKQ